MRGLNWAVAERGSCSDFAKLMLLLHIFLKAVRRTAAPLWNLPDRQRPRLDQSGYRSRSERMAAC